jgi:hypothetical protein
MTSVLLVAQRILDENNYTVADISLLNCEYLIQNATFWINGQADTSISFTPAAGAATLTATELEVSTVKLLGTLMVRAFLDRGPNASVQNVTVSALISDPQYALYTSMLNKNIEKLRGHAGIAFSVGQDDEDLEVTT